MKVILSRVLIFIIIFSFSFRTLGDSDCQEMLNWIYKEFTLENLDTSYERLMNKVLLGLAHVDKKTKSKRSIFNGSPELATLMNAIKSSDSKLSQAMGKNWSVWWQNLVFNPHNLNGSEFYKIVKEWKKFQDNNPKYFNDLAPEYKLDKWDMMTTEITVQTISLNKADSQYKDAIEKLGKKIRKAKQNLLEKRNFNLSSLKKEADHVGQKLSDFFQKHYFDTLNNFKNLCSEDELEHLRNIEQYVCPIPDRQAAPVINLDNIVDILLKHRETYPAPLPNLTIAKKPKIKALIQDPSIYIHEKDYETNEADPKTTFCKRDPNLATMIVLHHTVHNIPPEGVNAMHLNKGEPDDPWLMIGYNYLVENGDAVWRQNYQTNDPPKVYQGRPDAIQGSHAGAKTPPLSKEDIAFYSDKFVECGNNHEGKGFTKKPVLDLLDEHGGISGNFASLSVAVLGNYTPTMLLPPVGGANLPINIRAAPNFSKSLLQKLNPEFMDIESFSDQINNPHKASAHEKVTPEVLQTVAKLSCDLQKKYPNLRKIAPHNYLKDGRNGRGHTQCPGDLVNHLGTLQKMISELGCKFEIGVKRED